MEIQVKKPRIEPHFQSEVYRAMQGVNEFYRVVVGRQGTEIPKKVGEFIGYHAISDFMNAREIENWVNEQVQVLEKTGKRVEFDENQSYIVSKALEELASESKKPKIRIIFQRWRLN